MARERLNDKETLRNIARRWYPMFEMTSPEEQEEMLRHMRVSMRQPVRDDMTRPRCHGNATAEMPPRGHKFRCRDRREAVRPKGRNARKEIETFSSLPLKQNRLSPPYTH